MYNAKSDNFSPEIKLYTFIEIGNQMQNHKIETNSELIYERWKHLTDLNFKQNYRQRYTVIPITTVRGPLLPGLVTEGKCIYWKSVVVAERLLLKPRTGHKME